MPNECKIITLDELLKLKAERPVYYTESETTKNLGHGVTMRWYWGPNTSCFAVINQTVYCFDTKESGHKFWENTNTPPLGTVKLRYEAFKKCLDEPLDLNYSILTPAFFESCKMRRSDLRLVSENILSDGRVSLLYCDWSTYNNDSKEFYLVIGRLVLYYYRFEPLKKLEFAINAGVMQFWRPEINGTMDYIPKYNVSDYNSGRHSKYTLLELLIKEQTLSHGITAKVYRRVNKTVRYYFTIADKIYSFGSLEDCELILSKLNGSDFSSIPVMAPNARDVLNESIDIIAARVSRFMNADMSFCSRSELLSVNKKGSINGLKAII